MKWSIIGLFTLGLFLSCKESERDHIARLLHEWENKSIIYSSDTSFVSYGRHSIQKYDMKHKGYAIVTYVDSTGCMSCKLQLLEWGKLIETLDSVSNGTVPCLFFFNPKNKKDLIGLLKRTRFSYPVCIDENDSINKLNHFPSDMTFQTFLVDKDNKVVAIGNPIHNPKVKDLYLNIISGKKNIEKTDTPQTTISISEVDIDMGEFDWNKKQEREITISNTGNVPLVINDVTTSCGCTTVEYAKEPIMPKKNGILKVIYQADHAEHFNKTISVHCNTPTSPIQIKVTGNAKLK